MLTLSKTVTLKFCTLCSEVYNAWMIHKTFENDLTAKRMERFKCPFILKYLSKMTQEHILLQIVKLHDPAVQSGYSNLSINYIIESGEWDESTSGVLNKLKEKLEELKKLLLPARNKVLSHNDLETILSETVWGAFPKGKDVEYFNTLQEFVDLIHDKVVSGPYPLKIATVKNDAKVFVKIMTGKTQPLFQDD